MITHNGGEGGSGRCPGANGQILPCSCFHKSRGKFGVGHIFVNPELTLKPCLVVIIFSRPGRSQGLLYKHLRDSLID